MQKFNKDTFLKNPSQLYSSKSNGDFIVISYENALSVRIRFVITDCEITTQASHIREGAVMDNLKPSVCGVGFVGNGKYRSRVNGKAVKAYRTWGSMIERCYSKKCQAKHPTYIGCSVVEEWHNYQNFAKWFDENYIDGCELDKDIKIKGNKVYSPSTCIFVSMADNVIEARAGRYKFANPSGEIIEIYNLTAFCRANGLNRSGMSNVHLGNAGHSQQWRKA